MKGDNIELVLKNINNKVIVFKFLQRIFFKKIFTNIDVSE